MKNPLLPLLCAALPLLLFSEKTAAQTLVRIAGKVVEAGTERPVAGARVHNSSSGETVITRADGTFEITADTTYGLSEQDGQFAVYSVGFKPLNAPDPNGGRVFWPSEDGGYRGLDPIICQSGKWPRRVTSPLTLRLTPATVELTREIVVTARRQVALSNETARSVTVVSPRDLRQRPLRSVPESLFGTAGVWLQKTNHGGGSPFVRGLTGQQTLLLVDGIRLNNASFRSGPNQYLNTLDPVSVGRIEVLRGNGSVEYGSDAIGGVVNVQTPKFGGPGWHGQATLQAASQGMEQSGAVTTTYVKNKTWLWLGAAYRDFGDLVAGRGIGRLTPTGYQQWSYNAKLRTVLGKNLTLDALWQDAQQSEVPIFHKIQLENFALSQFNPQWRQFGYVRLQQRDNEYRRWFSAPSLTLSWQRQTEGRQSQKNGSDKTIRERDDTRTVGILAKFESRIASFWTAQTGADIYLDQVSSRREDQTGSAQPIAQRGLYPDGSSMSSAAVYSLHHFDWHYRWKVQAGLRGSFFQLRMSDETLGPVNIRPSALVGNASISRKIGEKTWAYATYNSAFRAPNVDDLGTLGIVDFRYETPNADLRPERSHTAEVGAKFQGNRFSATLAGYRTALTDLIGRVRTADSIQGYAVYQKENIGEAYIQGLEVETEWRMGRHWTALGHFTYTYGQNLSAREPVRRIPPAHGRMVLRWQPTEAFGLRAESVFASAQRRLAQGDVDDNRIADDGTPGWHILNLHGSWERKWLTISAEFHNIANEAYRTHGSGVDGMGRSLWMKVGVRW